MSRMRWRTVTFLVATCLMLATVRPAAAIVYGVPDDDPALYPNVGSMLVLDGGNPYQWCSGTLIRDGQGGGSNRGVFLTAAHCTAAVEAYGFTLADLRITFDQDGISGLIQVTGWDEHPDFVQRRSNPYDIGVLFFDAHTGLPPAAVADPDHFGDLGKRGIREETFTAVGYGALRDDKRRGFQGIDWDVVERYYATQHVQSLEKAWLTLAMNDRATENGGTCYGDSGGPHFHGGVIVSITVTGDAVCKAIDKTYRLDTPWAKDFLDDVLGQA